MEVKSIDLSWIVVSDIQKAIEYYTKVVGLKLMVFNEEYGWAELEGHKNGGRLGLAQANEEFNMKSGNNAVVCLTVDHIEDAIKEYKTQGVNLLGEMMEVPGIVKLQLCADNDGNRIQLAQNL